MWEPQRLTTLWAFTAYYRDSFTFTLTAEMMIFTTCAGKKGLIYTNLEVQWNENSQHVGIRSKFPVQGQTYFLKHH
jgi:hypothetical protein